MAVSGSVMMAPALSKFVAGAPPGLCDQVPFMSWRNQWKSAPSAGVVGVAGIAGLTTSTTFWAPGAGTCGQHIFFVLSTNPPPAGTLSLRAAFFTAWIDKDV